MSPLLRVAKNGRRPVLLTLTSMALLFATSPRLTAADASGPSVSLTEIFPDGYFVAIPAGEFMMGSPQTKEITPAPGRSCWNAEQPQHRVNLNAFEMGKFEVTQRQWVALMGKNPSFFRGLEGAEEHASGMVYATAVNSRFKNSLEQPVEGVSWNGAQQFIARINALDSEHSYRLPTEAEWEYACRAGTTGDYAGELDELGWYYSRENAFNQPQPHPVGEKKPNAWGLYDMHGNVYEWCEDPWHSTYVGAHEDGSVWFNARSTDKNYPDRHVLRGGSWLSRAAECQSAARWYRISDFTINWIGFRVVRTPKPVKP
jgi:formylglycine-generating enzyme required for sulfatase activity